jgi:hypothetical protein
MPEAAQDVHRAKSICAGGGPLGLRVLAIDLGLPDALTRLDGQQLHRGRRRHFPRHPFAAGGRVGIVGHPLRIIMVVVALQRGAGCNSV